MRIRILEVSKWKVSQASVRLGGLLALFGVVSYGLVSCSVSRGTVEPSTPSPEDTVAAGLGWKCDGGTPLDGGTIDIPPGSSTGNYLCLIPDSRLELSTKNCTDTATFSLNPASESPFKNNMNPPFTVPKGDGGFVEIKTSLTTKSFAYTFSCKTEGFKPDGTNNGTLEVATGGRDEEHPPRPQ